MNRRRLLAALATLGASGSASGCLGDGPNAPTATQSPTVSRGSMVGADFAPAAQCREPGSADVAYRPPNVVVTGCIRGANGCTVAAPDRVSMDYEADTLEVVVRTKEEREPDEACTEAIVNRGYRFTVEFADVLPARVQVTHDDVDGRRVVADVTRG